MSRALTLFESKLILDYNKGTLCNAIRYSCVRAKELDDKQGSPQTGSYFLSMLELSNAIRQELGLAASPVALAVQEATTAKLGKKGKKALDAALIRASEAELALTISQDALAVAIAEAAEASTGDADLEAALLKVEEQNIEIVALDAELEGAAKESTAINRDLEAMAAKIKSLEAKNKTLTATNKKLSKGAK